MAARTTSLIPFKLTNIPDRFTMLYVSDPTVVTTWTSGTSAVQRLNRLQGGSFTMATGVVDVVEMGSQYRPGGVDNLGEVSWNLTFNAVSVHNICALTGTAVPTTKGTNVTISATNLNSSTVDFIRMVADSTASVFATYYFQDCITTDYGVDVSESGLVSETASGKGPGSMVFPGYVIPKTYVVLAADVTAGYIALGTTGSGIFDANEAPVQVFQAQNGEPLTYWQQNGANYFLKIEKVPGANLANTPVRYFENGQAQTAANLTIAANAIKWISPQPLTGSTQAFFPKNAVVGNIVDFYSATAITQSATILAVAQQVNTTTATTITGGTTTTFTVASPTGIEGTGTFNGYTATGGIQLLLSGGGHTDVVLVSSIAGSSVTITTAPVNSYSGTTTVTTYAPSFLVQPTGTVAAGTNFAAHLSVAQNYVGQAMYNPVSGRLFLGDTLVAGDLIRAVFCTYSTVASLPTVVPNNGDPSDIAGVPSRMIPIAINGLNAKRIQKASLKLALKRDHVQGIGENAIVYGVSSVPDVSIDLDAKETDLTLLAQVQLGTQNLTSQGGPLQADFEDLNYITRQTLFSAVPVSINLYDPFNAAEILATWSTPQFIPTSIGVSSSNKSDNSLKITGMDITGNMTVSFTVPY